MLFAAIINDELIKYNSIKHILNIRGFSKKIKVSIFSTFFRK